MNEGYHPHFRAVDHVYTHRQFINDSANAAVDRHILSQSLTDQNESENESSNFTNIGRSAYVQPPSSPPIPHSTNISSHSLTTSSSTVTSHNTEMVDTVSSVPPAAQSDTTHSEPDMSSPQSLEKSSLHISSSNMSSTLMSYQSLHENTQDSPSPSLSRLTSEITLARETSGTFLTTASTTALSKQQDPHSQGYVLAVNYYEQQTMGLRNMMQLQCWAQRHR